ncbi:MAG: DNA polymerase IV [Sphingobacteriales bacterium]|nr:MAG: DNA polymerase IV [Sphingobacteriales bacterium]
MERHIVHLDLDSFFVSVERLRNSSLAGKPVIVGGLSDRGVVASCSYEARQFGVHSAMPMRLARQLCPHAEIVRGDMDEYARRSADVTEIISEAAPLVEKASIDEHYLDLSGLDKFFGCFKWTHELRERIMRETGLPISFGLSPNKTVSKIATGIGKGAGGEIQVKHGSEKSFLAPLSVRKIPMIGEKTYAVLRNMGIDRVSVLQQMPVTLMERALGDNGVMIWRKANGIDESPVVPLAERKSMSTETTFDKDTTDMELLRRVLAGMVDELAFDLRKDERLTSCITLKIRYSNFDTYTKQVHIPATSSDTVLLKTVLQLFERLYSKRMLIRLIGVKFSNLVSGSYQIDLFNDDITQINLCQAMDRIRSRFGTGSVKRVAAIDQKQLKNPKYAIRA